MDVLIVSFHETFSLERCGAVPFWENVALTDVIGRRDNWELFSVDHYKLNLNSMLVF